MSDSCPHCGSNILAIDNIPGSIICQGCGYVHEESSLSAEVTFGESSSGAAMLHGTIVGGDETRARSGGMRRGGGGESHEQTLNNGRRRIAEIANSIELSDHIREMAVRYFTLAVNNNFVKGRRSNYVVASCLYIACRMNKTNHMLIDFSESLQVNVFVLGNTFLRLVQSLSLSHKIPHVDPSLYIQRFASLLEFGEDTPRVAADATQLVTRFRDDWMVQGRRPAGICGACLLLAARMNNFRRSITEIIQVVKIADVTVKKRLDEFKATPAGQLSIETFRAIAPKMTESADPPAFTRVMLKEKSRHSAAQAQNQTSQQDEGGDNEKEGEEEEGVQEKSQDNDKDKQTQTTDDDEPAASSIEKKQKYSAIAEADRADMENEDDGEELNIKLDLIDQNMQDPDLEKEVGEVLTSKVGTDLQHELEVKEKEKKLAYQQKLLTAEEEEEANRLDNLDEDALDRMIMTDDEVMIKTHIWMSDNKDFLEKVAAKKLKEEAGEIDTKKRIRNRKKKQPRDSMTATGETAADSAKSMLKKRKISKKINYDVLSDLLNDTSSRQRSMSDIPESIWPLDQRKPSTSSPLKEDVKLTRPPVATGSALGPQRNEPEEEEEAEIIEEEHNPDETVIQEEEQVEETHDDDVDDDDEPGPEEEEDDSWARLRGRLRGRSQANDDDDDEGEEL